MLYAVMYGVQQNINSKQFIFVMVQHVPFPIFHIVPASFLNAEIDFGTLIIFHTVSAKVVNPRRPRTNVENVSNSGYTTYTY